MPMLKSLRAACCAALTLAAAQLPGVATAAYPEQPIRLVVPWPPGGATDALGRIIAQHLGERLKQPVIVDNKAGAGGNIGTAAFVRERPDGYTLLMATSSTNAANPHLYSHLSFDAEKDFAPVAFVASIPNILEVPKNSPFHSVQALLDAARANPGKLNYGSGGVGSSQHLAGSMFNHATGVDIVHIPYKGSAPAVADLLAGQVDMMLDTGSLAQVKAGALRALAVGSAKRLPALPDVPTFDELGIRNMHASAWYGVVAPAGTPKDVVDRLNREINAILAAPDVRKTLIGMGAELGEPQTPAQFAAFIHDEIGRYKTIVEQSGAKLD
ncbi:Bug family tripartite tricarboxylate transporter substrate binding protein [Bordetella genomosp. 9]|uniref:BugT protein n=1 Tax=Bordetella genomosp. 9 TaxID=1416803 RepID=A0A1W6Z0G8_9BORD|nr:bugT protein [Bordetella genomosp. 9]